MPGILSTEKQKKMLEILKERHPLFTQNYKSWKMYLDAYKGGSYVKNYIYKHPREGTDMVKNRRNKSVYPNYVRPIIGLYMSYVFRRDIDRTISEITEDTKTISDDSTMNEDQKANEFQAFWDDCDGRGTPINKFMKKAGILAKVFGHVGILVDMPKQDEKIESEADRKEANHRPYAVIYTPLDIVNWETDKKGNLLWVRLLEEYPVDSDPFVKEKDRSRTTKEESIENEEKRTKENIANPTPEKANIWLSRKGDSIKKYITWTKDEWYVHEIRPSKKGDPASVGKEVVEEIEHQKHGLGEVPLVMHYHEEDPIDPFIGNSFIQDIAPLNILIMNWLSMLDEEISQKTLNILVMQGATEDEVVIGANNVLTYEGDTAPQFIAPAATPGELIQTSIEKARDEIYRLAKLTGGVAQLKEVRSGVSWSYEFQEAEQTLSDTADELEEAEERIHRIWCKWMSMEWEGNIDYPEEFGVQDVLSDLKTLEQASTFVKSPTFKAEVQKKVVPSILPKIDETLSKTIDDEIDEMTQMETEQQLQGMADANAAREQQASGEIPPGEVPPPNEGAIPPPKEGGQ